MGTKDGTTSLPFFQIAAAFVITLCEAMEVEVLFPFVVFMVEDFGFTGSQMGFYVGLLSASFCLAQFCSAMFWGVLSDRFGRKPIMIVGLLCQGTSMFFFGLSKNFTFAIINRTMSGLGSGNVGVVKSFMTEFTVESNRGLAFSIATTAYLVGVMFAPIIGGCLSQPAIKYPSLFADTIFDEHPYFLPCLIVSSVDISSAIFLAFFMTETNALHVQKKLEGDESSASESIVTSDKSVNCEESGVDEEEEEDNEIFDCALFTWLWSPVGFLTQYFSAQQPYIRVPSEDEITNEIDGVQLTTVRPNNKNNGNDDILHKDDLQIAAILHVEPSDSSFLQPPSEPSVLSQKTVIYVTICYALVGMSYIIWDESMPLLLKYPKELGGFSFDSSAIGILMGASGVTGFFFTLYVMPPLELMYKKGWLYEMSVLWTIPMALAPPVIGLLSRQGLAITLTWVLLLVTTIVRNCLGVISFTIVIIQVNHSAPEHELGAVNGLGQTLCALGKAVGPALGGYLWGVSVSAEFLFPNFILSTFILWLSWIINKYYLHPRLEHPMKDKRKLKFVKDVGEV